MGIILLLPPHFSLSGFDSQSLFEAPVLCLVGAVIPRINKMINMTMILGACTVYNSAFSIQDCDW